MSPAEKEYVVQEIEKMLKQGVITKSSSPWNSPIVLVKKKDGTFRFCIDFRGVNAATCKDTYPLPRISEILDDLGDATFFSTFDMAAGYWQIEVHPEDRPKTSFNTPNGSYEWIVMPFGLTNAPADFQRLMDTIFRDQLRRSMLIY